MGNLLILLVWLVPIVVVIGAFLALWRIVKAQEEIARQLAAIAHKMGGAA